MNTWECWKMLEAFGWHEMTRGLVAFHVATFFSGLTTLCHNVSQCVTMCHVKIIKTSLMGSSSALASRRRAQLKIASAKGTSLCFNSTCARCALEVLVTKLQLQQMEGTTQYNTFLYISMSRQTEFQIVFIWAVRRNLSLVAAVGHWTALHLNFLNWSPDIFWYSKPICQLCPNIMHSLLG